MKRFRAIAILLLGFPYGAAAQDRVLSSWENRTRKTVAEQPAWAVPVITPSSGLTQLFRSDFMGLSMPDGTNTWNYGNSKGLNLIPWYKTEVDIAVPPYLQHNSTAADGLGDFSMMLKYRIASGNEKSGAYSLSASLGATIPTGSYKNGSPDAALIPTIYGGKGFGNFDVQSSVSATLPTGDAAKLGRPMAWNVVGQYRVARIFWPEIENSATFFHGGPNDGRKQDLIAPGIMVSKLKLGRAPGNHLALAFGAAEQFATTHFHLYKHGVVLSMRVAF